MTAPHAFDREVLRRTTAPYLLCERARSIPDSVAFRSKHLGIYRERCWRDYAALVAHAARALQTLHIKRGERVAIMGDACEEWMICDLQRNRSAPLPMVFIQRPHRLKSNIKCATVALRSLLPRTRNT